MKQRGPIIAYHEPSSVLLDNPVLTIGIYEPEDLDEFRAFIVKALRIRAAGIQIGGTQMTEQWSVGIR